MDRQSKRMHPTDTAPKAPPGDEGPRRGMRPEVRKAFEESWKRNEEAMRRLAKL